MFTEFSITEQSIKHKSGEKEMSSAQEVRYISNKAVKPAGLKNTELIQRIDLNPWDLKLLTAEHGQVGLLFLKPQCHSPPKDGEENPLINRLITSLSRTLDYFYPFAARLATETHEDGKISYYIDCNNMAGAKFIHATADVTVSDVLEPLYVPQIVHSFFPLNDVINLNTSQPLLGVQVTELIDGVFIGCSRNHVVCDGTSAWHFMNTWSEISKTMEHIPQSPPVLKRWFLDHTDCPIQFPSLNEDQFIASDPLPPLLERFFHFSPQNLAKLKANANKEQGTSTISTLQALLGHAWRAVTRARCLDSNQEVNYFLLANNRPRLNPRLTKEYFGNAIQRVTATAKAGELLERGSGWAAWLLNKAVITHDEPAIKRWVEHWVKEPMFISLAKEDGHNLVTGGSPRFNAYGNDFGWGRPIAVRFGGTNRADGEITVYQGEAEGSMDVEACLLPHTLEALGDDEEFMEFVTVLPPLSVLAMEKLNNTPLYGELIRVVQSQRDPVARRSGVGNVVWEGIINLVLQKWTIKIEMLVFASNKKRRF